MTGKVLTFTCADHFADTLRHTNFRVVSATFCYESDPNDRSILDDILVAGKELASSVFSGAANDSARSRQDEDTTIHCTAGLLAEWVWMRYLNKSSEIVRQTTFNTAADQIDLELVCNNKRAEVRSSFCRNGIAFALCNRRYEFDVIGPYSNGYKPDEPMKHFYLRTLYHVADPKSLIAGLLRDGFQTYLAGGATWDMMMDDGVAVDKSLVPNGDWGHDQTSKPSTYRVVPFSRALDAIEIHDLIRAEYHDRTVS